MDVGTGDPEPRANDPDARAWIRLAPAAQQPVLAKQPVELRARVNAGARIVRLQTGLADKVTQLESALGKVRRLSGLLPICSYCKAIRDDSDYWHRVEEFVSEHSDARFSHGICPECLDKALEDARLVGLGHRSQA